MRATGISRFEHFFRSVTELDVDKQDLKRYNDFINHKINDLLVRAQAAASANGRDIIEPTDLPITKGLLQSMHEFRRLDAQYQLKPLIDELTNRPPLDLNYSADTDAKLPEVAGGISVALARAFKTIDPKLKNPQAEQWETVFKVFDLLL